MIYITRSWRSIRQHASARRTFKCCDQCLGPANSSPGLSVMPAFDAFAERSLVMADIVWMSLQIPLTMTQRELEGMKRNEWFLDKHRGKPESCTESSDRKHLTDMQCKLSCRGTFSQSCSVQLHLSPAALGTCTQGPLVHQRSLMGNCKGCLCQHGLWL